MGQEAVIIQVTAEAARMAAAYGCKIDVHIKGGIFRPDTHVTITPTGVATINEREIDLTHETASEPAPFETTQVRPGA